MTVPPDPPPDSRWMQPDAEAELFRSAQELVAERPLIEEFASFIGVLEAWAGTPRAWVITRAVNVLLDASLGGGLTPRLVELRRRAEEPPDLFLLEALREGPPAKTRAVIEEVGDALAILAATGPGLSVDDVLVTTESDFLDVVAVSGSSALALLRSPREKYKVSGVLIDDASRQTWFSQENVSLPFQVRLMTNDSPVAGDEGFAVAPNVLIDRIVREAGTAHCSRPESFVVGAPLPFFIRDEERLEWMIADMRRERIEFKVSSLSAVVKTRAFQSEHPRERCVIRSPDRDAAKVIEELSARGGELLEMRPYFEDGETVLVFEAFSADLVGVGLALKKRARRSPIIGRSPPRWASREGRVEWRGRGGALVAKRNGVMSNIAHRKLALRHRLFVDVGEAVHAGMVIGECPDNEDASVDITAQAFRLMEANEAASAGPGRPTALSLAEALVWLGDGEVLEVTPSKLRIWKPGFDVGIGTETERVSA